VLSRTSPHPAMIAVLLGIAALGAPSLSALVAPLIPVAAAVVVVALVVARFLCEVSWCRVFGVVGWALKWAIVLGALLSLTMLSPALAFVVVVYGGFIAALLIALEPTGCQVPRMLTLP
jgi:hypothetical protein